MDSATRPCRLRVPVYEGLPPEIGRTRDVPHPRAARPHPSPPVLVCSLGQKRLVVIGVAEPWEVLHRLSLSEGRTDVVVRATTGAVLSPTSRFWLSGCRKLWVAEAELIRELGVRSVWFERSAVPGKPTDSDRWEGVG